MEYKLVVVSGETRNKEVVIKPPAVIGRSRDADVTLGHPLVSRRHCAITTDDQGLLVVEDLGSLNGTFHGEQRITEPVYLEPGDLLSIGTVTFRAVYGDYQEDEAAAPAAAASDEMPDFSAFDSDDGGEQAVADAVPVFEPTIDQQAPAESSQDAQQEEDELVEEAAEAVEEAEELEEEAEAVEEVEAVELGDNPDDSDATPKSDKGGEGFQFSWLEDDDEPSATDEDAKAGSSDSGLDDFFKGLG